MYVYLLATMDTKGDEARFVRDQLIDCGVPVRLVDTGCLAEPASDADVSRIELFSAAEADWKSVCEKGDRGQAVSLAAEGAKRIVGAAHASGQVSGVMSLGGSAGTTIGTAAMRALPLGVPKLMVSTLASGDVRPFVGSRDIMMLNSVVDILGLNRISRTILASAAAAMAGMIQHGCQVERTGAKTEERPLIAATMFGVTTPCVERARDVLERAGYEVLVFHATGTGGQTMESLIRDGLIAGVLDLTTTELADELVGGVLSAGPRRLTAAAESAIPQVDSVGATDMVNFWAMSTVPERFRQRTLYRHNENVTLMRTTADECRDIATEIATKVKASRGPWKVMVPLQGVSAIDRSEQPFDDRPARGALVDVLRRELNEAHYIEMDCHINDPQFAERAADELLRMMQDEAGS